MTFFQTPMGKASLDETHPQFGGCYSSSSSSSLLSTAAFQTPTDPLVSSVLQSVLTRSQPSKPSSRSPISSSPLETSSPTRTLVASPGESRRNSSLNFTLTI